MIVIVFNIFNLIEPYEAKISEGLFKTVQYTKVSIPIKKKYWPMGRAKQAKIRPSKLYLLTFHLSSKLDQQIYASKRDPYICIIRHIVCDKF